MADPAQQGAGLLFVDEEEAVIVLDGERSFSVRGSLSVFLKQVPEVLFREIKPPEPSLVLAEPNGGSFGAGTQAMTHSDPSVLSGELMAPLLLALGMLPQVASATSAFMIFFTSGANLVTYLAQGVLTPDPGYVVWIVTLGFCSAMVGRLSSVFITTRLRHPSFIVLTLGAILLVSMFLLIARVAQVEPQWAFSALCPTD